MQFVYLFQYYRVIERMKRDNRFPWKPFNDNAFNLNTRIPIGSSVRYERRNPRTRYSKVFSVPYVVSSPWPVTFTRTRRAVLRFPLRDAGRAGRESSDCIMRYIHTWRRNILEQRCLLVLPIFGTKARRTSERKGFAICRGTTVREQFPTVFSEQ